MPADVYEVVAQAARYWFLLLMGIIALRSYRWFSRDRKQRKKRLRLLPDAGYVGEMVVLHGSAELPEGSVLPLPREGVLGNLRQNDLYVPVEGVHKRHLWFCFEEDDGLRIEPYFGMHATVDGVELVGRHGHAFLHHGSRLSVGDCELRMRLFAGFEGETVAQAYVDDEPADVKMAQETCDPSETDALRQQLHMQQLYMQQMAQRQALMERQLQQQGAPQGPEADAEMGPNEESWPYVPYPHHDQVNFENSGYTYPEYV
ncbi:MAG: hypothetical protein EOM69_08895, partial [Clostridia bacterium]|nr:hypothetical protein [Clostridia bacterium]